MNLDLDEKSGGHVPVEEVRFVEEAAMKRDEVGKAVKQEQNEEAASIYISSDSDAKFVRNCTCSNYCKHPSLGVEEHLQKLL